MTWYQRGTITYEAALFYATNPNEFKLAVSGIKGTSDRTFEEESLKSASSSSVDDIERFGQ
jgi:hypothetical protein